MTNGGQSTKYYSPKEIVPLIEQAKAAVNKFRGWLEDRHKTMKGPSGIGIAEFNWYQKNVHLVPYTWAEQLRIADLKLHSREWTVEDAVQYAVKTTPYGWVLPDGATIWGDMSIYLSQPGYGTSYVVGKIQVEKLLADYSRMKGHEAGLKPFLDELFTKGIVPQSLIRWEMTGLDDEMKALGR